MVKSDQMEYPGDDPSSHNIENLLVCVDYPGKVVNVDKALETLNGIEEISKVCYCKKIKICP